MPDLKTAQEMMAAAVAAKGTEDPEIASVKRVLKLLDKTAKSNRTYGSTNPVAQKFSQQLFEELTGHLTTYSKLTVLIQRSGLLFRESVVYETDTDSTSESVAFRLYADGIRELTLYQGLAQEDLMYLLDSLWCGLDPAEDDDIVTRLWARNLSTISIITAEEIAQSSIDSATQADAGMSSSDSTLRDLLDRARNHKERAGGGTDGSGSAGGHKKRLQSNLVGYEISEEELASLAAEIEVESAQDDLLYIMDILTAILASEKSPDLLTKLFSIWGDILDILFRQGKWTVLEHVLSLLHESESIRPDLSDEHKQQAVSLLHGIGHANRVKAIETFLNQTPDSNTEGLSTILLSMQPDAVPLLCSLLANLESPAHQAIVSGALAVLARDQPQPLLKALADRRPAYVRNLLAILMKWNDPKFAEPVEKLVRYPDAQVRKEVVRAIGLFRQSGNGVKLISFMADGEESVRIAALKLLVSGQYTAPFPSWSPIVSEDEFTERPISERRAVFHAIRATSGDEAVPYWEGLLTEWSWTNRNKKEEMALLAAEALGKLATPSATAALELGAKKGGAAVRQACTHALSHAQRLRQGKASAETLQ
ncbi:MAG: HEAT repeat domain-containing protein [Nitrospira sp.]|nr:HEAT repeat domain-containing protein [Nitrospira sp.]MDH5252946.1 HEAT repeat domain-containing protein [Nitrospira sp.]